MSNLTGWGRGAWGGGGFGEELSQTVTGNQVTASVGSVVITARTPITVNVSGSDMTSATSSVTPSANAGVTLTTTDQLTASAGTSNVYGLIVTGQTTDWREVA